MDHICLGGGGEVDDTILETARLARELSGFVAVDNVSLRVRTGTIHVVPRREGSFLFRGAELARLMPPRCFAP